MNRCTHKNQTIMALILVCVLGIVRIFYGGMASSLSYQEDIGVNFTFNSALNITLSSSDIHIDNLAPGSSADSNIVNVNVLTNSTYGYTLNATVGNSTTYDTDDLVHSNSGISNVFSNTAFSSTPTITTNANLAADTWAFSYSTDNGTNWANYNGLPMYDDTDHVAVLKESNGPVATNTGDDIKFKIGAKASSAQASGTYRNVVNFNLVAAPGPTTIAMAFQSAGATQVNGYYKMQDMTPEICAAVEVENDQLQMIDIRDNKVYWVAKLEDGKCWMTQNLDHDIDSTYAYSSANTDIPSGWNESLPDTSTSGVVFAVPSNTAASLDPGNVCWNGQSYDWNLEPSFAEMTQACTDTHYHIGNYYNFTAAVALEDSSSYTSDNYDLNQSICPAGWMLPKAGSNGLYVDPGSFYYLLVTTLGYPSYGTVSLNALFEAPFYLVKGETWGTSQDEITGDPIARESRVGSDAVYMSSVTYGGGNFWGVSLGSDYLSLPAYVDRYDGVPIRCVSR